jgi:hypothetical protein
VITKETIERTILISIVIISLGTAFLLSCNDNTEPQITTNQIWSTRPRVSDPLKTFLEPIPLSQNEETLLKDIIQFISEQIPENMIGRIRQLKLQPRPVNKKYIQEFSNISKADKIKKTLHAEGDLELTIEVIFEADTPIFLGYLEKIKTKNRIFETSWQKKTR